MRLTARIAILLVSLAPSLAVAAEEPPTCRNGLFPAEVTEPGLARVTPGARLDVLEDYGGCPGDAPKCKGERPLSPGAMVLTGQRFGDYICIFQPDKVGGNAGYVRSERLSMQNPKPPAPPDWLGVWRDGDNELKITSGKDGLKVLGKAYWPSRRPPKGAGGPNIGAVRGEARPDGGKLAVTDADDDDCVVTLTLVGSLLMARDTGYCGGHNVRFNGVFRKR